VAGILDGFRLAPSPDPGGGFLLWDGFEVTRGEFLAGKENPPPSPGEADLPMTWVDRKEAKTFAAMRGMRLPTLAEWRFLASSGNPASLSNFPWGKTKFYEHAANTLRLGLERPLPVGVFESGRSLWGGYDLAGNVWEWVADAPPGTHPPSLPPHLGAACGGSFASWEEAVRIGSVRLMDPRDRAEDVGFRCVAEAGPWLREHALPVWIHGSPADRDALRESFSLWPRELRADLCRRLEDQGVWADFCEALRSGRD